MKKIFCRILFSFVFLTFACSSFAVEKVYPVVILGGGMGGLSAALYLARAGMTPLIIEGKEAGGLMTQSHRVENWPGEEGIAGPVLMEKIRKQVQGYGTIFLAEEVVQVDFSKRPFKIVTRGVWDRKLHEIQAQSCIIAMGSLPNHLSIPGEKEYWGMGVSHCAICDGALYRGKKVAVIGGGDGAIMEAEYLSSFCEKVYLVVRKKAFRVKDEKRKEALLKKNNIETLYETLVEGIEGDQKKISHLVLKKEGQKKEQLAVDGVFLAIGTTPNTSIFKGQLNLDASGYIVLEKGQQTSISGVYAVGDITDPMYQQAITAAADGAKAAIEAQRFLSSQQLLEPQGKPVGVVESHLEMVEIQNAEHLKKEMESFSGFVLVDFYAPWCGPCKRLAPLLEKKIEALQGKVKLLKVNVEQNAALATTYTIREMPTLLIFDLKKNLVEKKTGPVEILDRMALFEEMKDLSLSEMDQKIQAR